MYNVLLERLDKGPLVCDGAMGSLLYDSGISYKHCYEELNVSKPDLIQQIHNSYIKAGAEIIETNTFGGNRYKLETHGYGDKVREFNLKAARLAREVRDISGEPVLVAGSIGPLGRSFGPGGISPAEARAAFKEQIEALMEGLVDFLILETFYDFQEMWQALTVAKQISDLPVVAQMGFTEEGQTLSGQYPEEVVNMLRERGADVIGLNCQIGPQGSLSVAQRMAHTQFPYLSVQPNAGAPTRVEGRIFYNASPAYYATYAPQFIEAGVKLIGGCCGTTPAHIAAIRQAVRSYKPTHKTFSVELEVATPELIFSPPHSADGAPPEEVTTQIEVPPSLLEQQIRSAKSTAPTQLAQKLAEGKFVVSVELMPAKGINPALMLRGADKMMALGADVVNITDNAMAKVRMGALGCAQLVQRSLGIEAIVHYTSRDRNLMALQSDLLGAHASGIRNILALTGDPPRIGDYPGASGIWDVDSLGVVAMMARFNQGLDWNGTSLGSAAHFNIGCAFNPTSEDLPTEVERLRKKIEAGAQFIMTQPIFDAQLLRDTLAALGDVKIPILAGILLLRDYKNAEFIHQEVPGIVIPDTVLERMREAGEKGIQESLAISMDLLEEIQDMVQGIYIMPHGKYDAAGELVKLVRGR
jgi:homocysteine S-methyltransferase